MGDLAGKGLFQDNVAGCMHTVAKVIAERLTELDAVADTEVGHLAGLDCAASHMRHLNIRDPNPDYPHAQDADTAGGRSAHATPCMLRWDQYRLVHDWTITRSHFLPPAGSCIGHAGLLQKSQPVRWRRLLHAET